MPTTRTSAAAPARVHSLDDHRSKTTNVFFEFYKNFKQRFTEVKTLQDQKENQIRAGGDPIEVQRMRFQIKNGVNSLHDYGNKMSKAITLVTKRNPGFDVSELEEIVERCNKLITVLERKEQNNLKNSSDSNRNGLNREEQILLDGWEDQMRDIVGLLGRHLRAGLRRTEGRRGRLGQSDRSALTRNWMSMPS
jgi:hypothetical protein